MGLILEDGKYTAILLGFDLNLGLGFSLPKVEQFEDVVLYGLNTRSIGLNFPQTVDVGVFGLS